MYPRFTPQLLATLALGALVPPAQAQEVKDPLIVLDQLHAQELVIDGAGQSAHVTLPAFDEEQGVLLGADLYFHAVIVHELLAENVAAQADTMVLRGPAGVAMFCENTGRLDMTAADVIFAQRLDAFDGRKDASGPSGTKLAIVTETWKREVDLGESPDELAALGNSQSREVVLTMTAVDLAEVFGRQIASRTHARFEVSVAIVYRYAPYLDDVVMLPPYAPGTPHSSTYPTKLPLPGNQGNVASQSGSSAPGGGGSVTAAINLAQSPTSPPPIWSGILNSDLTSRSAVRLP